ncbi:helix-turn-helix domain-containing protein [Paenibacillus sp. OV219]|uniref:helix-turn-helix domain-containing protein n=1 Tax=Paenibacillus sp. OV219 TaxID=1884377 RepID=UPI0008CAE37C|nr:helix-turn-helix transcriptional regulator [Paenibacillus sp. OV219]SEM80619.1 DNA-binding transcriptional regulator, XRE-family HTH domain [Paenibacillus sp. OV219]
MKLINLENERQLKGWTQEEAAKKVGVARSTYSNWENGKREPDFEASQKLADIFEVSVDYLFGKSQFRNADELAQKYIDLDKKFKGSKGAVEHSENEDTSVGRAFFGGADKYTEEEIEVARAAAGAAIEAMRKARKNKQEGK